MFLAGVVGSLLVIAAVVLLTDLGGGGTNKNTGIASPVPSQAVSSAASVLPEGVKCSGADCAGQDPENMGCGGAFARTVTNTTVGTTLVEVRYSETCGAAWARITRATLGDKVTVEGTMADTGKGTPESGTVDADLDAYTPMIAVTDPSQAKACATLVSGTTGCTTAP
jgi:hypothetical protein